MLCDFQKIEFLFDEIRTEGIRSHREDIAKQGVRPNPLPAFSPMSTACWGSVTLVSQDGNKVRVPVDVLSAASPVWRERFTLTGDYAKENCICEEPYSVEAIEAFVKVISHGSQDSAPESVVVMETLVRAMPLIHKYDCPGAIHVLEETHFPELPKDGLTLGTKREQCGRVCIDFKTETPSMRCYYKAPAWLTQHHLDYIVLKQELWGAASLSSTMKKILAHALVGRIITADTGIVHKNGKLGVHWKEPSANAPEEGWWLTLAAWRLQICTLQDLFEHITLLPT